MSHPPRDRKQAIEALYPTAKSLIEVEKRGYRRATDPINKNSSIPIVDGVFLLEETAVSTSETNSRKPHSMVKSANES